MQGHNELDVVAMGLDGDILVGECKWGRVDDADLNKLRARHCSWPT